MKPAAGRLLLTAVLFAGWLGYLGYLVWTRPRVPTGGDGLSGLHAPPLVLSRPQFLVSALDVVGRVDDLNKSIKIVKVLYTPDGRPVEEGDVITVEDLALLGDSATQAAAAWSLVGQSQCRQSIGAGPVPYFLGVAQSAVTTDGFNGPHPPPGWSGPGEYLLPLLALNTKDKKSYRVAPIPSSPGYSRLEPRIYPATPEALAQYRELPKAVP